MLSAMILIVGLTGLIGTSLVGKVLDGRLHVTLAVIPVAMAAVAVAMAAFGTSSWLTAGLLALWGMLSTAAPAAWSTCLTRTLPNDAESGARLLLPTLHLPH